MGLEFLPSSIAHSGRWAPNLQGNLRSPTFTLTHNHLHLRLAGRSSRIRLIIARYGLREFNPLLFESTQIDVDAGADFTWRSISSGLHRHRGRLAYLELLDDGDGFVALDQMVSTDDPTPPTQPERVWIPETTQGLGHGPEEHPISRNCCSHHPSGTADYWIGEALKKRFPPSLIPSGQPHGNCPTRCAHWP